MDSQGCATVDVLNPVSSSVHSFLFFQCVYLDMFIC